jgi:hypothetical protein
LARKKEVNKRYAGPKEKEVINIQPGWSLILSIKSQTRPSRPRFDEWRELTAARGHDGRAAFNTERGVGP